MEALGPWLRLFFKADILGSLAKQALKSCMVTNKLYLIKNDPLLNDIALLLKPK